MTSFPLEAGDDTEEPPFADTIPSRHPAPEGDNPMYLLEMARTFSILHDSHPVLCQNFLPGIDLCVSASADGWSPLQSSNPEIEARGLEVIELVEQTRPAVMQRPDWFRAVTSFGLVRWWSLRLREQAIHSLGPFHIVIHCNAEGEPVVHIDECLVSSSHELFTEPWMT